MNEGINDPTNRLYETQNQPIGSGDVEKPGHDRQSLLAELVFAPRLENSVEKILEIANELTGARLLAVYLAANQLPVFKRSTGKGSYDLLPEDLPMQEIVNLNKPQIWMMGKRPRSTLHRAALAANLPYLVSAPLSSTRTASGLIAFSGEGPLDEGDMLFLAQLLAESLMIAIQYQALNTHAQSSQQVLQAQLLSAQAMEEHTSEGIILLSPTLKIQRMNSSAKSMLGYTSRETSGQPVEKVLIGSETLYQALNMAQHGSPTFSYAQEQLSGNVRLYRRSGEDFLAQVRVFPVGEAEQVKHILVFFQDLSEQDQLRTQMQQLEQRALLGEVTHEFIHEVRDPVNIISTGLDLMAMNLGEQDPNQATIARMLRACERLDELLKSVRPFTRPVEYAMEPVDLAVLVRQLLESLNSQITRVKVQASLHVEPGSPVIMGNPHALEQVFTNLISNALHAMETPDGRLAIKIHFDLSTQGRKYVLVSVADTGRGIPAELHERIFQPFFTTERSGTGLGLAITKRIVTAHKGNIRLESFPGGTVFHVQFPAYNPKDEVTQ